jgi:hypothetical protein
MSNALSCGGMAGEQLGYTTRTARKKAEAKRRGGSSPS